MSAGAQGNNVKDSDPKQPRYLGSGLGGVGRTRMRLGAAAYLIHGDSSKCTAGPSVALPDSKRGGEGVRFKWGIL